MMCQGDWYSCGSKGGKDAYDADDGAAESHESALPYGLLVMDTIANIAFIILIAIYASEKRSEHV
jgi:hypothetical protein